MKIPGFEILLKYLQEQPIKKGETRRVSTLSNPAQATPEE